MAGGYSAHESAIIDAGAQIGDGTRIWHWVHVCAKARIGANCFLMIGSHVAHDCVVGDRSVLVNNATLGGHVEIGEHVILGGLAAVQQHCRVGAHAFIGGLSGINTDVIPFASAIGERAELGGLNIVGLKRRGFDRATIHALRAAEQPNSPAGPAGWTSHLGGAICWPDQVQCGSAPLPRTTIALGVPGHVAEHVALVDDRGIPHPGAGRFQPGAVEHLDDAFGQLNGGGRLGLRQSWRLVVIRPVPQPPPAQELLRERRGAVPAYGR